MDGTIRGTLETYSGKLLLRIFGLCFNPEFIALGHVLHNSLFPILYLIGEADTRFGDTLRDIYLSCVIINHPCAN